METQSIRPTKKQRELLEFIEQFISQHGYSPSYREVMNGLNYTSVATVSLHINSLIRRGHLRKRDRSARSLEVVAQVSDAKGSIVEPAGTGEEQWLIGKVEGLFKSLEEAVQVPQHAVDELHVLVGSLKVLGLATAAENFEPRLAELSKKVD